MTPVYKFLINKMIIRKPIRICLSYTCLFHYIHLSRRKCVQTALRHYSTETIKAKVFNTSKNSLQKKIIKNRSELRKLFVLAASEKWRLTCAVAFLIVSSTVTMAVPFSVGKIIDIIYTSDKKKSKENLIRVSLVLLIIFFIGAICNFSRIYLISTSGHRITQSLRKKVYASILSQETAMFDTVSTGELVGRLTGNFSYLL